MTTTAILRSTLLLLAPLAILAATEFGPGPDSPTDAPPPWWIQLDHALVGALGQPFLVTAELSSRTNQEVACAGEVADGTGRLLLSGQWDLVLDEIRAGAVIASASLKPAAAGAAVVSRTVSPRIRPRASWTWDAQALFTHAGNYQFHLHYGGSIYHGRMFHIDTDLGPPEWIRLEVVPDKRRALLGEPVEVSFRVTNAGKDTYPMHLGDFRGTSRTVTFSFSAVRSDGAAGWDPEPLQTYTGGMMRLDGLPPGASEHEEVILGAYVRFPGPGTYQVHAYHGMGFGTPAPGAGGGRQALAGSFTIDMEAPTAADCERIVRAGIAADRDYDRWRRLAHLHEPGYLEPLRRALDAGVTAQTAAYLVDGIDSIATTDASAALIACLDDPRPQLQRHALDLLTARMPEVDRSAQSAAPAEARERHRLQLLLSGQTWDDEQQRGLVAKLPALLASADAELRNSILMLMGRLGTPDAGETIGRLADRLALVEPLPEQEDHAFTSLKNAAYALGEAHGAWCHADIHSSPGRLICWSHMVAASGQDGQGSTPAADALRLAMLSLPDPRIRSAALTALYHDAARLPIPWMALFQDPDPVIWRHALQVAYHTPHAPILAVLRACTRTGFDADKCKWFDDALRDFIEHADP